ncbi:proteasome maturation factor UMP1 [Pyrrhoderma noxium]|uniref:Proteasome maturation factor UMP1 n=1 Tax=Pyrrhoderma noxium TaxID=2282107 RepID=A0A286UQC4_9AGAM|nr:proteasome maturation factor UMP1 [Pyrrhoderma noxium]
MSSLKLVPGQEAKTSATKATTNSYGLHDTLQHGLRSLAAEANQQSAFKHRLDNWEETQDNLKLTLQRNLYGIHAPVRLAMERKIVSTSFHMPALPRSNIHLDILMGRDETVDVTDVFDERGTTTSLDIHGDMERKLRM